MVGLVVFATVDLNSTDLFFYRQADREVEADGMRQDGVGFASRTGF